MGLAGDGGGRLSSGTTTPVSRSPPARSQLARDSGALEVLAVGVNVLGQAVALGGDFASAALLIAEADAVTEATGTLVAPYGALVLAGYPRPRGRGLRADRRHHQGGHRRRPGNRRPVRALGQRGGDERPRPLRGGARRGHRGERRHARARSSPSWALSELIEAATRTGNTELAARALARLGRARADGTTPSGRSACEARARALLSEGDAAERLYREAIDRLGRTRLRPDLARGRLLYGEWLRRAESARRRSRAAAGRARGVRVHGRRRVRRTRRVVSSSPRARRCAVAGRHARRAHPPGGADRAARPRRTDEPGDRRPAVPQPAHRRVAPAQGVHQARDQLPQRAPLGAARHRPDGRTRLGPGVIPGAGPVTSRGRAVR